MASRSTSRTSKSSTKSKAAKGGSASKASAPKTKAAKSAARSAPPKKAAKNGAAKASAARASAPKSAAAKNGSKSRAQGAANLAPASPARPTIPPPSNVVEAKAKAHSTKAERAFAQARQQEVDDTCAAWAAIVAERMAADQDFAQLVEEYASRPGDLRGLFLWDALHAAESNLTLVNGVIARHLGADRRADPMAILGDLRLEQRKQAATYAVNAYLAVLDQMSPAKPKWVGMTGEFDQKIAVLALAHQTMGYALAAGRIATPEGDLTDHILHAAQDETVWAFRRGPDGDRLFASCAAAAAFFRTVAALDPNGGNASGLNTLEDIVELYVERARSIAS